MKTIFLIFIFVITVGISGYGKVITGQSNTLLQEYQINRVDDNTYKLSYSDAEATFTIEVCHEKNECCYLLRGDAVEVMYLCNELGFGMRKMPDRLKTLETASYKQFINSESFSQQSLLSCNQKNKDEALALIACFFPLVVKAESYGAVFNYRPEGGNDKLSLNK